MQSTDNILYTGVPVDYYFFPGDQEYIYYGEFKIENNSDNDIEIKFDKCELIISGGAQKIDAFFIHAGKDGIEVTDKKLKTKGNSVVPIRITFPFISVAEFRFVTLAIRSDITYHSNSKTAVAEINLFYEKKMKE